MGRKSSQSPVRTLRGGRKASRKTGRGIKEGRFFGFTIPKEYGGEGWSVVDWFTVLEELAKAYATVRLIAHTMNGLFWRPLLQFGTEEQKKNYLPKPKLATGEIWAANSLTEPEAGTGKDINSKAIRDKEYYVVNGHKWLITLFPDYTKLIYTFAATEEGITAFLVDVPTKGLVLKPMAKMMGCVGPRHYNVIYENCRVPASSILGEKGKGLDVAFGMLHLSRVSIPHMSGISKPFNILVLWIWGNQRQMW